ncbi:MAG: hypothetical protein KAS86_01855, partial [Candidatus Omnitrophica bacterium]|nr:hypothetical protein [Candidatus Omnitrophota bacterium]
KLHIDVDYRDLYDWYLPERWIFMLQSISMWILTLGIPATLIERKFRISGKINRWIDSQHLKRLQRRLKEEPELGWKSIVGTALAITAGASGAISIQIVLAGMSGIFVPYFIYKYLILHAAAKVDEKKKNMTLDELRERCGEILGASYNVRVDPDAEWTPAKGLYAHTDLDETTGRAVIHIKESTARAPDRALIPILMHEKGETDLRAPPSLFVKIVRSLPLPLETRANILELSYCMTSIFSEPEQGSVGGIKEIPVVSEEPAPGVKKTETPELRGSGRVSPEGEELTESEQALLREAGFDSYRLGQIPAMRTLKNGKFAELRTGGGKTLTLGGAALSRYRERGERVLLFTHSDELTEQAMVKDKMGVMLSRCGAAVGFILPDGKGGERGVIFKDGRKEDVSKADIGRVYEECAIIYTKWDRAVHRSMQERIGHAPQALRKSRYFALFDEADLMLVFGSATPCIISGEDMDDWESRRVARRAIDKEVSGIMANEDHYYARKDTKQVYLTGAGQAFARKALGRLSKKFSKQDEEISNIIKADGSSFVIDAIKARLFYRENVHYYTRLDRQGNIVGVDVRDEQTGDRKVGMSFGEGLQQAVEIVAGVPDSKVTPEKYTLMSETIGQFLSGDLIMDSAGASGTMEKTRLQAMYPGKEVEEFEGIAQKLDKTAGHTGYRDKAAKRQDLLRRVELRARKNQPILIKADHDADAGDLKEFLEANLPAAIYGELTVNIADGRDPANFRSNIAKAGYANVITIVNNIAHRGIDIEIKGRRLNADGTEGEEVPPVGGSAPGLHVISTYLDEAEAFEIQTQGRADRGANQGSWEGLFSLDEKIFEEHASLLANHKQLLEKVVEKGDMGRVEKLISEIRELIVSEQNRNDEEKRKNEDRVFDYQSKFLSLLKVTRLKETE